jgi:hypothetical protein
MKVTLGRPGPFCLAHHESVVHGDHTMSSTPALRKVERLVVARQVRRGAGGRAGAGGERPTVLPLKGRSSSRPSTARCHGAVSPAGRLPSELGTSCGSPSVCVDWGYTQDVGLRLVNPIDCDYTGHWPCQSEAPALTELKYVVAPRERHFGPAGCHPAGELGTSWASGSSAQQEQCCSRARPGGGGAGAPRAGRD